ncbi:ROK family transcriptional regulator [Hoyosella sp. YIM 151337]|uniref:ROK family transcriptional regulator n=1 Tax=Hoyosella sp. YIM 151337 TaxID=2992742 RepID=UPI002236AAF9|nr:ROK family transcriptional regulator [Hoyosella sp. YIM 151337]MCW4352194.1 ROK family transcriptional regulator [Hoyosella sp. YIM 151337]
MKEPLTVVPGATAGEILALLRRRGPLTRSEIGRLTGHSRTAVTARVDQLLARDLVVERAAAESTGGRPPVRLELNAHGGVVLAGALGASRTIMAVCDLAGEPLAETELSVDLSDGPAVVLGAAAAEFAQLLDDSGFGKEAVRGIGLSVPGAVDVVTGRSVSPPVQQGWGDVPFLDYFTARFPVPITVDNDVNALALEQRRRHPDVDDLVVIKASTGIGAGIICRGTLIRGTVGAAGEIGHIKVSDGGGALCRCGGIDCLEAVAAGWALTPKLAAAGLPVKRTLDIADLARDGDPAAVRAVRDAGRCIGEVAAALINVLNPELLFVDGDLAYAAEPLIAGMREVIYQRATAMATRKLRIEASDLHGQGSVAACATMILDDILSPRAVDSLLAAA